MGDEATALSTPQRRKAGRGPRNIGKAEGCLESEPPETASRSAPLLKTQVDTTAPSLRQKSGTKSKNAVHTDRLFCEVVVVVEVGNREVEARRVGCSAEFSSDGNALDGPRGVPERARDVDRRAREVACNSVLVEKNNTAVLGDHVQILRLRDVGHAPLRWLASVRGPDLLAWPKWQEKSCSLSIDRQFSEQGVVQVGKKGAWGFNEMVS